MPNASIHSLEEHRAQLMAARGVADFNAGWLIETPEPDVVVIRVEKALTVEEARMLWRVLGARLGESC